MEFVYTMDGFNTWWETWKLHLLHGPLGTMLRCIDSSYDPSPAECEERLMPTNDSGELFCYLLTALVQLPIKRPCYKKTRSSRTRSPTPPASDHTKSVSEHSADKGSASSYQEKQTSGPTTINLSSNGNNASCHRANPEPDAHQQADEGTSLNTESQFVSIAQLRPFNSRHRLRARTRESFIDSQIYASRCS